MKNQWERACTRKRSDIQHGCWLLRRLREQARTHWFVVGRQSCVRI